MVILGGVICMEGSLVEFFGLLDSGSSPGMTFKSWSWVDSGSDARNDD